MLEAEDFHYGIRGRFTLVRCTGCSLGFLDPMYSDEELSQFYPSSYYSFADRFLRKGSSPLRSWAKGVLGLREHQTKDPKFVRPGRMLDVGCGSGWFLCKMREEGWDVTGVEPSLAAARLGQSQQGLNIFPGSLLDAAFPDQSFDYIRFSHSFEHVADPNVILAEVHRILTLDGKLMIALPNRSGINAKIFGPFWYHLALPIHPFSYSTKTLSLILGKHSFKVEKVIFNTERTSIQGSFQMFLNKDDEVRGTEGRVARNRIIRILCTWLAHLENAFRIADVIEVTAVKQ